MMSLMLAPSLFRYFLRTLLYSSRLADGRFDFVGLLCYVVVVDVVEESGNV